MNELEAFLSNELRLLLTDRFLQKLAMAVRIIPDLENRRAVERFVYRLYALSGKAYPDLTPYIERKQATISEDEIHVQSLMMRGFL